MARLMGAKEGRLRSGTGVDEIDALTAEDKEPEFEVTHNKPATHLKGINRRLVLTGCTRS